MGFSSTASMVCYTRTPYAGRASRRDQQIQTLLKDRCLLFHYSGNPCRLGAARLRPPQAGRGTESPDTTCGTLSPIRRSTRACESAAEDGHHAGSIASVAFLPSVC